MSTPVCSSGDSLYVLCSRVMADLESMEATTPEGRMFVEGALDAVLQHCDHIYFRQLVALQTVVQDVVKSTLVTVIQKGFRL